MINGKRVLALIPARGGSKGLPGKNIKKICGKPLIQWSIEKALKSESVDYVLVSTDCEKIQKISLEAGANSPFLRPEQLASDTASSVDVGMHALNYLFEEKKLEFDYLILLEPTSPLREDDDIDSMVRTLDDLRESVDGVVSLGEVHEHPDIMKKVIDNKVKPYGEVSSEQRRQDLSKVYFPYGVGYLIKVDTFKKERSYYANKVAPYFIKRYQNYEVDDLYDFMAIEAVMKHEWSLN